MPANEMLTALIKVVAEKARPKSGEAVMKV